LTGELLWSREEIPGRFGGYQIYIMSGSEDKVREVGRPTLGHRKKNIQTEL
jgi:hypothetical protein